jgi:hypothetical protein
MNSRIRRLSDSVFPMAILVVGGLIYHLAAPAAPPPPVRHPVGCHACSVSAPPAVVAAFDAELVRIGAVEAANTDELQ